MDVELSAGNAVVPDTLTLPGSKSETNRLLLLQALYPQITINNIADADDCIVMQEALHTKSNIINIHHAGTAMRFLTAYFALQEGRTVLLTGSERMKQRPVGILVDALRSMGAEINYLEQEGYPPLQITGKKLTGDTLTVNANISSQYITALLLIAPKLSNGLKVILQGAVTSLPYIKMTLSLLGRIGIKVTMQDNIIQVYPENNTVKPISYTIESDWSAASYFYSLAALSPIGTTLTLTSFIKDSYQGDSALVTIYQFFGVETNFTDDSIILTKVKPNQQPVLKISLHDTPDIAQTIAVTCLGLGISCELLGLHTLKIKETDRLRAMKTELEKCNATVTITEESLSMKRPSQISGKNKKSISIKTYNDHRMAMAFAPLAVKLPLIIKDAGVVSKSYPAFWEDLKKAGINVNKL